MTNKTVNTKNQPKAPKQQIVQKTIFYWLLGANDRLQGDRGGGGNQKKRKRGKGKEKKKEERKKKKKERKKKKEKRKYLNRFKIKRGQFEFRNCLERVVKAMSYCFSPSSPSTQIQKEGGRRGFVSLFPEQPIFVV